MACSGLFWKRVPFADLCVVITLPNNHTSHSHELTQTNTPGRQSLHRHTGIGIRGRLTSRHGANHQIVVLHRAVRVHTSSQPREQPTPHRLVPRSRLQTLLQLRHHLHLRLRLNTPTRPYEEDECVQRRVQSVAQQTLRVHAQTLQMHPLARQLRVVRTAPLQQV